MFNFLIIVESAHSSSVLVLALELERKIRIDPLFIPLKSHQQRCYNFAVRSYYSYYYVLPEIEHSKKKILASVRYDPAKLVEVVSFWNSIDMRSNILTTTYSNIHIQVHFCFQLVIKVSPIATIYITIKFLTFNSSFWMYLLCCFQQRNSLKMMPLTHYWLRSTRLYMETLWMATMMSCVMILSMHSQ